MNLQKSCQLAATARAADQLVDPAAAVRTDKLCSRCPVFVRGVGVSHHATEPDWLWLLALHRTLYHCSSSTEFPDGAAMALLGTLYIIGSCSSCSHSSCSRVQGVRHCQTLALPIWQEYQS